MRRGALLLLLLFTAFLLFSIHMVWNLLGLLVFDGSADVIARTELPQPPDADADADANAEASPRLPHGAMIPKILHQTGKNATIPPVWQDAQHSCVALHSPARGWEYRYWTDAASLAFIRDEYPWFLPTFQGYAHPIQRADAIRYFALAHYGGVYLDLDDGCARPLDPLLAYPAWLRKTHPTGISNDAMGAVAGHPFFTRVLRELPRYDRNWGLPYVTVMGSTGPLFLSVLWRRYSGEGRNVGDGRDGGRIRILFPDEYQGQPWSFFTHHLGNSWHTVDVDFIFWMARNWVLVTLAGFAIGFGIISIVWFVYTRFAGRSSTFSPLSAAAAASPDVSRWKLDSIRSRFPFWQRASARKEYELVSRHEV